jgi:glycosyltransferase involved in cell wall biosynthesis
VTDNGNSVARLRAEHAELASLPFAGRHILMIVENLPVPFDRRVWIEARTLAAAGAKVSVICPTGKGFEARRETIEGIDIYRHPLALEAKGAFGYLLEYGGALFWECWLAWRLFLRHRFDAIHGCNPPDLIFLVALPFRLFGVRFLFDHHDINPELFEAKFGKRGLLWKAVSLLERLTFRTAKVSIATNESYKAIAVERGGMEPGDVFVVRSGPDLSRVAPVPPHEKWRNKRRFLVAYLGVMGDQEGIDLLLEAIRHLVHNRGRTDIYFGLAGSGPALVKMQCIARELDISEHVSFHGRVSDTDLFELLCSADLCVNPDRVNPMNDLSTMNKIMEYMAMGKPIVQFDVREGRASALDASLYAKPNDPVDLAAKIEELLADPEQREAMGRFGQERVRQALGWNTQVPALIAAYQRLFS